MELGQQLMVEKSFGTYLEVIIQVSSLQVLHMHLQLMAKITVSRFRFTVVCKCNKQLQNRATEFNYSLGDSNY